MARIKKMFYNHRMFRPGGIFRSGTMSRPRRGTAVITTGMAFFILALFFGPGELLAQPRIVFKKEAINFGKTVSGTEIHGKFIVSNKGDRTLKIEGLRPG